MALYKVTTQWLGYSEIIVEADDATHAQQLVEDNDYDPANERLTGDGSGLPGYEQETVIDVRHHLVSEQVHEVEDIA